jgi:hypothetical protein
MRKILPLLALALCCLSCYAPFDLSMSQAAVLLSNPKLTYRGTVGPITNLDGDSEDMDFRFHPDKTMPVVGVDAGIDFRSGFLVMQGRTRTRLQYVRSLGGANPYEIIWGWERDHYPRTPQYEPSVVETLKYANIAESSIVILADPNPDDPASREVSILKAMFPGPPPSSISLFWNANLRMMFGSGNASGYSIRPTAFDFNIDRAYVLYRNDPALNGPFSEVRSDIRNAVPGGLLPVRTYPLYTVPELDGVARCQYFHNEDLLRSYVSWFDTAAGSWKCISWDGPGPVVTTSLPITHRIDAVLTNGQLFSTEDETGRLYQANGDEVSTFPLGSVRFVGERYIDFALDGVTTSDATVIFSLARMTWGKDSRTLSIDLYTIPTADLETLGR